jgi:tetratricopeptide (TPR) repeat protein
MIFFRRSHVYDPAWPVTPQERWLIWTSGWRGALVLTSLILGLVLSWNGVEIYQKVKIWRAERLIAQSEAARKKGDLQEATSALRQAAVLMPRHPLVLRAVAQHQMEMQDLSALETYTKLVKTPEATLDDKVTLGRQAFRLGRPEMAAEVLKEVNSLPAPQQTAATLALKAEQTATQGNWPEALKLARQCSASTGSDEDHAYAQFVLARLLLQQPTPPPPEAQALRTEGMDLLCTLALRQDEGGVEALGTLLLLSQNPQAAPLFLGRDFTPLLAAIERNPHASAGHKVGVWNLRLAAAPTQKAKISQELYEHIWLQQLKPKDDGPALRLETARWLNQKGMHQLTLDLARPEKLESKEWFVLFLDATAALGRWEDVLSAVNATDHEIPLSPALKKLFGLRAELETGRKPDIAEAWRDIRVSSQKAPTNDQLYIAGYAEQIGFPAEAGRIYEHLLSRSEALLPAEDKLNRPRRLACYTGHVRTGAAALPLKDLSKLMSDFAKEFPEIDEVRNDNAYLQLLIGKDHDEATSTAQELTEKKPEILAYRTTLALALLKQQKTAEAAAIYQGWSIDWNTAPDRYKAVYAAVMRGAGRKQEADQVAAKIQAGSLRPEELQLAGLP